MAGCIIVLIIVKCCIATGHFDTFLIPFGKKIILESSLHSEHSMTIAALITPTVSECFAPLFSLRRNVSKTPTFHQPSSISMAFLTNPSAFCNLLLASSASTFALIIMRAVFTCPFALLRYSSACS